MRPAFLAVLCPMVKTLELWDIRVPNIDTQFAAICGLFNLT
jgi:hypothetical protein